MSGTIQIELLSPTVNVAVPSMGVNVGFVGPQGPPGEVGQTLDIKGTLPDGNPPVDPGAESGDAWIDPTGGFWVWDGTAWVHMSGSAGLDQATADALYVNVAGDTMAGPLTLSADPTFALHAATKKYVDGRTGGVWLDQPTADALYVNVTGDAMTGPLTLQADPTIPLHAATKAYVDANAGTGGLDQATADSLYVNVTGDTITGQLQINGELSVTNELVVSGAATVDGGLNSTNGAWFNALDMGFGVITALGEPVNPEDATTKQYVDNAVAAGGGGGGLDQATADSLYVNVAGDTMTGILSFNGSGITINDGWVHLDGSNNDITVNGGFEVFHLASDISHNVGFWRDSGSGNEPLMAAQPHEPVTKAYLESVVGSGGGLDQPTADALYVNITGDTLTGPLVLAADPTIPLHAATKQYADTKAGFTVSATEPTTKVAGLIWVVTP